MLVWAPRCLGTLTAVEGFSRREPHCPRRRLEQTKESPLELDDRVRPAWGVGVFARLHKGLVRIALDDLHRLPCETSPLPQWEMSAFFTHSDRDADAVLNHQLSKEDYEALGRTVMARLVALLQVHGNSG